MVYSYAIDHLKFQSAHANMRKANERVLKFHERFGTKRVDETELNIYYQLGGEEIAVVHQRYRHILDESVQVDFL